MAGFILAEAGKKGINPHLIRNELALIINMLTTQNNLHKFT